MNRWIIGFGLLLLLLAPVFATYAPQNYATPQATQGPASSNNPSEIARWECAGNFTKDDVIMVELLPNIFWAQSPTAFDLVDFGNGTTLSIFYVNINITDPTNDMSAYELWLHYDQISNRFTVYNASALSFGIGISSDVLLPNKFAFSYTFIAGSAKLNGTYLANIISAGWPYDYRANNNTIVPSTFELFYVRTTLKLSKPYANLLYVSYALIPTGIVFIVYGSRKRTKPLRKASSRNRDGRLPKSTAR
jgi:hypothetical protein